MTRARLHVIALMMLLGSAPSRADDGKAAELLRTAIQQFSEAKFASSLSLLERARQMIANRATCARVRLYIGLNHAVLGREQQARAAFRAALSHDPLLVLKPEEIKPAIVAIFDEERSKLGGELVVAADRVPAEVEVDGRRVGPAPYQRVVVIGSHRVVVRSTDGCFSASQRVAVPVGGVKIELRLTLAAGSPCGTPFRAVSSPARRRWTYVVAGTAVAVLIAGIGVGASSQVDYNEYSTTADPRRGEELAHAVATKDRAANVLFGIGGALAVTSAVLFFVEGRRAPSPARAVRRVTLEAGPLGVTVRGRL